MKLLTNDEIVETFFYNFKKIYEQFLKDAEGYGPFKEIHLSVVEQLVHNNVILMIDDLENCLGFVAYNYQDEELFISALYVIPEMRNRGIASELLQRIPPKIQNGVRLPEIVYCYSDNQIALAFYEKQGFKEYFKGLYRN